MKKDRLDTEKYPRIYQEYLEREKELVIDFLKGSNNVLDVGCGTGRIIPFVIGEVGKYTGVDINPDYLSEARLRFNGYTNGEVINYNAERLSGKFSPDEFDKTISLWNTIGCLRQPGKVLREISDVTKNRFLFSLISKGTLDKRIEYYDLLGIPCKINERTETIRSREWGISRAYSIKEIGKLVSLTDFKVSDIITINNFAYIVYLDK